MNLRRVTLLSDRRMGVADLEKILARLPLTVRGTRDLKLQARMGLGRIIYIQPKEGEIRHAEIQAETDEKYAGETYLLFAYDGHKFSVGYNRWILRK